MFKSFHRWLDQKLGVDAYELRGDEIVSRHIMLRFSPWWRIRCQDISGWREVGCMGWFVEIEFKSGRVLSCGDRREELVQILRRISPGKELPFETV
jgi:hypothetical protein